MSSFENMEIFEDTKKLCETNGRIKDTLARSVKNQKLIPEGMELPTVDKAHFKDEAKMTQITLSQEQVCGLSRRLQVMQARRWQYITLLPRPIRAAA